MWPLCSETGSTTLPTTSAAFTHRQFGLSGALQEIGNRAFRRRGHIFRSLRTMTADSFSGSSSAT
jgi:hypothetical protein